MRHYTIITVLQLRCVHNRGSNATGDISTLGARAEAYLSQYFTFANAPNAPRQANGNAGNVKVRQSSVCVKMDQDASICAIENVSPNLRHYSY